METHDTPESTYKLRDPNGNCHDVKLSIYDYRNAGRHGLTLSQYLEQKYGHGTDTEKYGSVMGQFMQSANLFLRTDKRSGRGAPSIDAILNQSINLGAVTREDGSDTTPSGRLLFPEIILQTVNAALTESDDSFLSGWNDMIGLTTSIPGPMFVQPKIDATAPEGSRASAISQLAEPNMMVSITTEQISKKITTRSIGLTISDEAQKASTLDLVNIALAAQARGEQIALVHEHISNIVSGNVDLEQSALPSVTAQSFDSLISGAGTITHRALVKWLRSGYRFRDISHVITTQDVAFAIDDRDGKPTVNTVYADGSMFPAQPNITNLLTNVPSILIVDDGVIAANTIVGLDKRYGIHRVINANASYQAIEQYVMRRATSFRVDYGEIAYRLYPQAFSVVTLTV